MTVGVPPARGLERINREILRCLQRDARIPMAQIAREAHLSVTRRT